MKVKTSKEHDEKIEKYKKEITMNKDEKCYLQLHLNQVY